MLRGLAGSSPEQSPELFEQKLLQWIEDSLATGRNRLGQGYQGQTLLYSDNHQRLVVKAPSGRGVRYLFSRYMLRREARVYEHLAGLDGVAPYHGLLAGRYLVLGYVDGVQARAAPIEDREQFFAELRVLLESLHARGVAHSDLQKKDNLFVVDGRRPCLLDFGAAVQRKPGFAPLNHLHFDFARRLDINQWVKLKYRGRLDEASEEDRLLYRRTFLERLARALKRTGRCLRTGSPDRRSG